MSVETRGKGEQIVMERCDDGGSVTSSSESLGIREPPVTSFYLRTVPVYEEQDPFQYYTFWSVAGRGGYATVYNIQHTESGQRFACKVIHTKDSEVDVERALKEACMHSILSDHPNVATLKEVWTFGLKHVFLIMDECTGGEIFDSIISRGALPEKDAASIVRVILQFIHYCHCKGIIHHDIKPENLMLKDKDHGLEKSNIRFIDFGCTAFYDEATKKLSGTPLYAAPEIIKGPHHDFRSDLWSAGVCLFCMLTGLMPFEGETNHDMKQAVLYQPIDFQEDPWPFVSEESKDLCSRLLQRDPDDRISLDDALHHPWLREQCLEEVASFCRHEAIPLMQDSSVRTSLQQLLMLLYVHKSGRDQHAFSALFDWMDCNGDGRISRGDLKLGLLKLVDHASESQVEELVARLSHLSEDTVRLEDFLAATSSVDCLLSLEELLACHPDQRLNSMYTVDNFCNLLADHGVDCSRSAVCEIVDCAESKGQACNILHKLQAAWNGCSFTSTASLESALSSDAIDIELRHIWTRAAADKHRSSSLAGNSPIRGGSPATESSWDRMKTVRGGSPATLGYTGFEPAMGCSPVHTSSLTSDNTMGNNAEKRCEEAFCSGGVVYWDGHDSHANWDEEEDSDSLYGPALAALQAKHLENPLH